MNTWIFSCINDDWWWGFRVGKIVGICFISFYIQQNALIDIRIMQPTGNPCFVYYSRPLLRKFTFKWTKWQKECRVFSLFPQNRYSIKILKGISCLRNNFAISRIRSKLLHDQDYFGTHLFLAARNSKYNGLPLVTKIDLSKYTKRIIYSFPFQNNTEFQWLQCKMYTKLENHVPGLSSAFMPLLTSVLAWTAQIYFCNKMNVFNKRKRKETKVVLIIFPNTKNKSIWLFSSWLRCMLFTHVFLVFGIALSGRRVVA